MKNVLIICLLFISAHSFTFAQKWTTEMDSVLRVLEQDSLFDGQLLIAEKGNIIYSKSYGHTVSSTPISNETSMSVYSVGKSFTTTAIMILEKKELLDYDDPVKNFIPDFPYSRITVRQLLTMTSGLPRFLETALKYADTTTLISNREILQLIARHKPGAGTPGAEFAYNNSNYILLASIVEKVSGLPFAEFLDKNIFTPLNMENTRETTSRSIENLSKSEINSDNFYRPYGTGSVATTATDLFKYDQALYSDKLLSPASKKEAFKCVKLADGLYSNYGFGWRINDCDNPKEVYHVGDGTNMRASFQRFLGTRNTFIYIHANSNIYHQQVYRAVRNIWEGKPYELPQKRIAYNIDTALYQKYTGSYLSNFGLVNVSTDDGKLFLRPDPVPAKEELVPSSDTTFYFKNQNLEWEFFLDENGDVAGFGIKGDRENMGSRQ